MVVVVLVVVLIVRGVSSAVWPAIVPVPDIVAVVSRFSVLAVPLVPLTPVAGWARLVWPATSDVAVVSVAGGVVLSVVAFGSWVEVCVWVVVVVVVVVLVWAMANVARARHIAVNRMMGTRLISVVSSFGPYASFQSADHSPGRHPGAQLVRCTPVMERFIGRFAPHLYALLRIIAGLMFLLHGAQKILGWPEGRPGPLPMVAVVAGWIELVGGALIAVGLFGSFAAFIASGLMAFAYWMGHGLEGSFWPTVNKGELAVLYCFLFLYVAAAGSGIWSLDSARKRTGSRAAP